MISLRSLPLAAVVVLAACGDSQPSSLSTTTDSAGVAIVVGPATDTALSWTLTEVRRIGGADTGVASFTQVSGYSVATDGRSTIAVLDWVGAERIHLFDSSGTWLRSVGAKGGGPGELQWPGGVTMDRNGGIVVVDYDKSAVLRWAADGRHLGETKLNGRLPWGMPRFIGDSMLAIQHAGDTNTRISRLEILSPRDTTPIDSVVGPAPKMVMLSCVGLSLPPLFSSDLAWGMGSNVIATTAQSRYIVDVREDGRMMRSVRRAITPVAATKADAARLYPDGMKVKFGGGRECVTPSSEVAEKIGVAATIPLVKAVAVAPDGALWVQRYTFEGETPSVDVFDRDGRYLGTVTGKPIPLGFLGNDLVLFPIENSDDGTGVIGVYRITRS